MQGFIYSGEMVSFPLTLKLPYNDISRKITIQAFMLFPISFNMSVPISGYKNGCGLLELVSVRLKIFCLVLLAHTQWNLICIIIIANSLTMHF